MMAEQVDTFHTKPYIAPIVANAIVIDTTAYSALISGKIESDGGLPILSCGICYSTTSEEPILADSMYIESTQIADSFVCELTNLTVVTTYYARAYAINSIGTSYSDVITFTTLSTTASLGAISTTEIGLTSATIAGEILADGGYQGDLAAWVKEKYGWDLEVVLRPKESSKKFNVIPNWWIVERTFSWLENYRRLTIDYEFLTETAEAMVSIAFIQIALNRFF